MLHKLGILFVLSFTILELSLAGPYDIIDSSGECKTGTTSTISLKKLWSYINEYDQPIFSIQFESQEGSHINFNMRRIWHNGQGEITRDNIPMLSENLEDMAERRPRVYNALMISQSIVTKINKQKYIIIIPEWWEH